jgi:hypothetical protein
LCGKLQGTAHGGVLEITPALSHVCHLWS